MVVYPAGAGNSLCPGVLLALARFIPAGAGNTLPLSALLARNTVYPRWRGEHRSSHYFLSSSTVYPRWRGEHSASLMPIIGLGGLSSLARGTRRQRIVRLPLHRFIPAGAGNTSTLSITTDREPVYPRWRGEHPNGSALSYPQIGLSRWRGEHKVTR